MTEFTSLTPISLTLSLSMSPVRELGRRPTSRTLIGRKFHGGPSMLGTDRLRDDYSGLEPIPIDRFELSSTTKTTRSLKGPRLVASSSTEGDKTIPDWN
jgi:hypothetical protein